MGDFGEALRRAREAAGRDLIDLAETTKIQPRYIEALETENWKIVPSGIIGRGFVRVIARELGLPVAELLEKYRVARGDDDPLPGRVLPDAELKVDEGSRRRLIPVLVAAAVVILALASVWVWNARRGSSGGGTAAVPESPAAGGGGAVSSAPAAVAPAPAPPPATPVPTASPPPQAQAAPAPAPSPKPAASPSPAPGPAPAAAAGAAEGAGKGTLEIVGVEEVWVRVVPGKGPAQAFTLSPGERKSFETQEGVQVRLGKALGARLFWNGEALKPAGERTDVVTVSLPRDLEQLRP
jgi:cytoskeleton protein RodZ